MPLQSQALLLQNTVGTSTAILAENPHQASSYNLPFIKFAADPAFICTLLASNILLHAGLASKAFQIGLRSGLTLHVALLCREET